MSRENVEWVRAALQAVEREGPEAILDSLDPDIEWMADRSDMGQVVYRGHEGSSVFTAGPNGKLIRYESFGNPAKALGAVGLGE